MAAPTGNQFWRQRATHGREMLFSSPDLLWDAACEYFDWCDNNPFDTVEYNGKDANRCIVPKLRVYTLTGLLIFLGVNHRYLSDFKRRLKKTERDLAFGEVIQRIEDTIYTQKFEGAAAGLLSTNLIVRDLGLTEKQSVETKGNVEHKHSGKVEVTVRNSGVPLATNEGDVDAKR